MPRRYSVSQWSNSSETRMQKRQSCGHVAWPQRPMLIQHEPEQRSFTKLSFSLTILLDPPHVTNRTTPLLLTKPRGFEVPIIDGEGCSGVSTYADVQMTIFAPRRCPHDNGKNLAPILHDCWAMSKRAVGICGYSSVRLALNYLFRVGPPNRVPSRRNNRRILARVKCLSDDAASPKWNCNQPRRGHAPTEALASVQFPGVLWNR